MRRIQVIQNHHPSKLAPFFAPARDPADGRKADQYDIGMLLWKGCTRCAHP